MIFHLDLLSIVILLLVRMTNKKHARDSGHKRRNFAQFQQTTPIAFCLLEVILEADYLGQGKILTCIPLLQDWHEVSQAEIHRIDKERIVIIPTPLLVLPRIRCLPAKAFPPAPESAFCTYL
jgi:hypothetical protein